ncbi:MAG TPA: elongation factor 4, partial [candidate division CPR3 bacterium]|nr:elongation factor 4 [candidate division CPR3 bacterium]
QNTDDFDVLKDAVNKLHLNDPSFVSEPEAHEALGRGFRCGFLGVLHSEIIAERIQREFSVPLVISRPSVEFSVTDKKGKELSIKTAVDWPDPTQIESIKEPWAQVEVITPASFYPKALQLLEQIEGTQKDIVYLSEKTVQLVYEAPLREIIIDFNDKLKSVTQGMASMDYEIIDMREGDLVKLEVLIAGEIQEAFSKVVPKVSAYQEGKTLVAKLKEVLPAQQFSVALQAVVGGKVLARETIGSRRRDVTASLYGGDVTRKNKLLDKQKKGKKELKAKGRVIIPPKVFLDVFRS